MSSVRRVFNYLVCIITLGIFAGGIGVLLSLVFDIAIPGSDVVDRSSFIQQQLSLGLAMLVIGGPLWFVFWRNIQKHVRNNILEAGATLRKFFLNLILTISALTVVFSGQFTLTWMLSGFPGSNEIYGTLATLIVSFLIWIYHWKISEKEGHPSSSAGTLRRWYIYITSGWGLVLLAIGIVQFINYTFLELPFWGAFITNHNYWSYSVQGNLAAIVFGGALWAFHWFRMARKDTDSILHQVYIYLLALIVSSIAGLVSIIIGLYKTLIWVLGAAGEINCSYFQYLAWIIPTILVTSAVWTYHKTLATEEASQLQERLLSSKRIHFYIMSFIGLGALITGLIYLFGTLIDLFINALNPALVSNPSWWQTQLSLALALLIVAVPIWLYYWKQIIQLSGSGGITEWRAKSRRIYLYIVIGASIIALAAALVNLIYRVLGGALSGDFTLNILLNSKWSIQIIIVALPLLIYHWQIARNDQRKGAEVAFVSKSVTAIIDSRQKDLLTILENKLGLKIRILETLSPQIDLPVITEDQIINAVSEIAASSNRSFMLFMYEGKIVVLPYRET
jgi:hypothetical protein